MANSALENRVYDIRPDILEFIRQQPANPNIDRNKNLLETGKVTYGQLERILHDMKTIDKKKNSSIYNLYGGKMMEEWGKMILKNDRDLVRNRKASKKLANDIGGDRKNAFLSTHSKRDSFLPPTNLIKANSELSSVSSFSPIKVSSIFEEVKRIKDLML
jgi:hypothetical protein